jgi:hypothetical protein
MSMSNKPSDPLMGWFERLVKNKMAGVAVSVPGIAVSCFILTFGKLFSDFVFFSVSIIGLILLGTSVGLLIYASVRQVAASFSATASTRSRKLSPSVTDQLD